MVPENTEELYCDPAARKIKKIWELIQSLAPVDKLESKPESK